MELSPYLDCPDNLSDSPLTLFYFFMIILGPYNLIIWVPFLYFVDHLILARLLFFHRILLSQILTFYLIEIHVLLVEVFESTEAVLPIWVFDVVNVVYILILCEYLTCLLLRRIGLYENFRVIESLEYYLTVSEGLDDGAELWEIKFFILDHQTFLGEVN